MNRLYRLQCLCVLEDAQKERDREGERGERDGVSPFFSESASRRPEYLQWDRVSFFFFCRTAAAQNVCILCICVCEISLKCKLIYFLSCGCHFINQASQCTCTQVHTHNYGQVSVSIYRFHGAQRVCVCVTNLVSFTCISLVTPNLLWFKIVFHF